jgi:hypothetical protein
MPAPVANRHAIQPSATAGRVQKRKGRPKAPWSCEWARRSAFYLACGSRARLRRRSRVAGHRTRRRIAWRGRVGRCADPRRGCRGRATRGAGRCLAYRILLHSRLPCRHRRAVRGLGFLHIARLRRGSPAGCVRLGRCLSKVHHPACATLIGIRRRECHRHASCHYRQYKLLHLKPLSAKKKNDRVLNCGRG